MGSYTRALVYTHLAQKEYMDAMQTARDCQELFQKVGDIKGEASALLTVCSVYQSMGKPDEAVLVAKEAQALYHEENDLRGEATTLRFVAEVRTNNNEHDRALHAADRALGFLEKLGDRRGVMRVLLLIAENRILSIVKKYTTMKAPWHELANAAKATKQALELAQDLRTSARRPAPSTPRPRSISSTGGWRKRCPASTRPCSCSSSRGTSVLRQLRSS